ncbi:hypothetical protein OG381_34270 [Streptomyces sp. NBC_00490]|uniref:hypothetical protein n=1 Tax=Streptomyces sp. NBC_00490 TaxID=2903657 RepID=UPI002E17267D
MNKTAGALVGALLLFGAVGCSEYNDERGKGDAPVAGRGGDDSAKHVTNNPDGFGNVATGCVYGAPGFRYFVTTNTGSAPSNLVVRVDEACK